MSGTDVGTVAVVERQEDAATGQPCDWNGCDREAVVALRFHDQAGHVHDCAPHAAELREFCDVAESQPLPCPWLHNGAIWQDAPRELR